MQAGPLPHLALWVVVVHRELQSPFEVGQGSSEFDQDAFSLYKACIELASLMQRIGYGQDEE